MHKPGSETTRGKLPESVWVPESPTGSVTSLRLLGLYDHRLVSSFVRYLSSFFFIRSDYICGRLALPLFAAWMHKARSLPRDQFKREVDQHLTGKDTEPTEIVYFKFYQSQIPVIEQAIDTAALMLGTDKSRGYCL